MAPKRGAVSEKDFLASVKIGVVPDPGPQIRRDYSPKGSVIPGLNDMVWESYTKDETMVVSCPPGMEDKIFAELLKAKNYLNYLHRDDVPKVDVRGLEKAAIQVVNPDDITDVRERTAYRKIIPIGQVGVRFKARPPLMKGRRAQQARLRSAATTKTTAAKPGSTQSRTKRAATTNADANKVMNPFSG